MVQREVAARIVSPPGSKEYGILSVLLQAYYNTEILFNVSPGVFRPPPAVMSSVMRLSRNDRSFLECDESFFLRIVKTAFNQRRKMLSNSLKAITGGPFPGLPFSDKRPEQLSVDDLIKITLHIQTAGITGNIKNNLKPDEGVKFDNII
jgi:16S rRNA (adenine1518-N6/adenine1519-N6)-dimethyltransferase